MSWRGCFLLLILTSGLAGCSSAQHEALRAGPDVPFPGDSLPERPAPHGPLTLNQSVCLALRHGHLEGVSVPVLVREKLIGAAKGGNTPAAKHRAKLELELDLHALAHVVEGAYWTLFGARAILGIRQKVLEETRQERRDAQKLFEEERLTRQDLARFDEQIILLEADVAQAAGEVHEAALALRLAVGLSPGPCAELVLADTPHLAPPPLDLDCAIRTALHSRPELTIGHFEISDTMAAAFSGDPKQHDEALLEHEKARIDLADQREKIAFAVRQAHVRVLVAFQQARLAAGRKEAAARRVQAAVEKNREKEFADLNELFQVRRDLADAERDEVQKVCLYRVSLAAFEREQGTLLWRYSRCVPSSTRCLSPEVNHASPDPLP